MIPVLTNIFRDLVPLQVGNARLTLGRSGVRTSVHKGIHWTDTILNHGVYMLALLRCLFFCGRTIEATDQRIPDDDSRWNIHAVELEESEPFSLVHINRPLVYSAYCYGKLYSTMKSSCVR